MEKQEGTQCHHFFLGMLLGLGLGGMLGAQYKQTARTWKKSATRASHTVAEAMENLRESLQQHL